MKVALIVSPYPLEESPAPPLGLCYAAAAFEAAGAEVCILDYLVRQYTPEKLFAELSRFQPDIVGTNSVTLNFYQAAAILKTVKQLFPDVITVMGGPHVSFDYQNTLKQYPEIDLIVVGEGEETIREVVQSNCDRRQWAAIKGIAYLQESEPWFTGKRDFIQDLDSLPLPARHLIPLSRYQALGFPVSIITSRGCPNQCIFCQGRRMVGAKVRYRSISKMFDEIESILDYGFNRLNIADDFFTSNRDRVMAFCEEIHKRNLHFGWSAFARADSVNQEILKTMLDAGCDSVLFGIESGNQEMLDRIRKRVKLNRIREAVADCRAVGMRVLGTFIVGLPGETQETLMDSHRFAQELGIEYGYHFLAPFPGTTVKENIQDYDLQLLTEDWSCFDANRAIVKTSQLSAEDIERFVHDYYFSHVQAEEEEALKRCQQGQGTEMELLLYIGKQKNEIVHQLFSRDLIESHAIFPFSDDNGQSLHQLTDMIATQLNKEIQIVEPIIRQIIRSGYLTSKTADGVIKWHWTHNNKMEQPPIILKN
ncbi:MAG: B12-binding domain-containing radical SAM protein [Thermodesulfobacteriota bacterium]